MTDHPDAKPSDDPVTEAKVAGLCLLLAALDEEPARREAGMLAQLTQLLLGGTEKVGRVLGFVTARTVLALINQHGTAEAARKALAKDLTTLLQQT